MSNSLAQEMMDEFLQRQEEYEKIYKTYQFAQRPIRSEQYLNQRPHKIKDSVKLVYSKYLEQNRSLRCNKRQENLSLRASSIMKAKKINGREIQRKKYLENRPIDLGLVIVIFIPLVCFLTLLTEFI